MNEKLKTVLAVLMAILAPAMVGLFSGRCLAYLLWDV